MLNFRECIIFWGVLFSLTSLEPFAPPHPSDDRLDQPARAVQFLLSRSASIVHRDHEAVNEGFFSGRSKVSSDPLPSRSLTWNLKIGNPKRKLIFQPSFSGAMLNFGGVLGDAHFLGVTEL